MPSPTTATSLLRRDMLWFMLPKTSFGVSRTSDLDEWFLSTVATLLPSVSSITHGRRVTSTPSISRKIRRIAGTWHGTARMQWVRKKFLNSLVTFKVESLHDIVQDVIHELDASLPATAGSAHETIRMSSDVKWKQKHTSIINDHKHWTSRTSNRDLMMSDGAGNRSCSPCLS